MKEKIRPLLIKLLVMDAIFIIIAITSAHYWLGWNHFPGMLFALIITTLNALGAFYFSAKGLKGTMNDFMLKAMGGMGLRLGILLMIIILLIAFTNIPHFSFIFSLFISYICKSVLEIISILNLRNQSQLLGK